MDNQFTEIDERLELMQAQDIHRKKMALVHLTKALQIAGVSVSMNLDTKRELVILQFLSSKKPNKAVNIALDNAMAMLYDIFKQAGHDFLEEA